MCSNVLSQNSLHVNSILIPPLSLPSTLRKYNVRHEGLYTLPLEAITDFKAYLVHTIQNKLNGHFSGSGRQNISFPCLESLFFGVFKDHIHYYNYRSGSYKCFFQES